MPRPSFDLCERLFAEDFSTWSLQHQFDYTERNIRCACRWIRLSLVSMCFAIRPRELTVTKSWNTHETSVVAVHGIGAHPEWTWTTNGVNWLSDPNMLPAVIRNSRILTFGYASDWFGKEAIDQQLFIVAEQLLRSLIRLRQDCPRRPVVLVGHCFGGVVIEKAIILAKTHDESNLELLRCIAGIVFLGTPHRGSRSQSIAKVFARLASATGHGQYTSLLKIIEEDSAILGELLNDFARIVKRVDIPLYCFFEQKKSNLTRILKRWQKFLPRKREIIVDRRSACIDGFPCMGLRVDHFQISKFSNAQDGNFVYISDQIKNMVDSATKRVGLRLRASPMSSRSHVIDDDLAALNALFVTDPASDMENIQDQKDKVLEDTGAWITSHHTFTAWFHAKQDHTIWIHGDPGKGKTMLAVALVKELNARIPHEGSTTTTAMAYFFCDNKDGRRNTAESVLRSLIYQILCQKPDLCHFLRDPYEKQKAQFFNSPNLLQSLWKIFQNIVTHGDLRRIYIVVDALDECETNSLEAFLDLLEPYLEVMKQSTTNHTPAEINSRPLPEIKWLLTSRNTLLTQQRLGSCLGISLEENQAEVDSSVKRFITVKVEQLRKRKEFDQDLCERIKTTLQEKSEGTFLWVALACRELGKPEVLSIHVPETLLEFPAGLDLLYGRILDQILGSKKESSVVHVKAILRAMVVAFQPMSLLELGVVANLPDGHRTDIPYLKDYLRSCSSLITLRDDVAHFVHQSAKTFLLSNDIASILSSDPSRDHRDLALNCFNYISSRRISEARGSSAINSEETHRALTYPMLFWADHMREASTDVIDNIDVHAEFFQPESMVRQAWLDYYWLRRHAKWETKPGDFTAGHVLAYAGLTPLLEKLLERVNCEHTVQLDSLGNTPLAWAARNGFEKTVCLLASSGADVGHKNKDGVTALHWAAGYGHVNVVQYLRDRGADGNTSDKNGWTPLHRAAYNGHKDVVELLLRLQANVDALDGTTWTAMHRAATMGQTKVVRLLVEHGASIEIRDREGMTPMLHAAWAGQDEVVQFFLESKVDVNDKDDNEWSSLHNAAWKGHLNTVNLLLEYKVDLDASNKDGCTALHQAASGGNEKVVEALLRAGANVDARAYEERETALHQAAWHGKLSCVQSLLSHKARTNIQNTVGHTALHHAAANGHEAIVRTLIGRGANPNIIDKHGHLPIISAKKNNHRVVVRILRNARLDYTDGTVKAEELLPVDVNVAVPILPDAELDYTDDTTAAVELPPVDINVAKALGVDHCTTTVQPHQAAGFFVPEKITVNINGTKRYFYMKSGTKQDMFESEYISLKRLHMAVETLAPRPIARGKFSASAKDTYYLVTEWIDEDTGDAGRDPGTGLTLAQKVAKLHNARAPIPDGSSVPMFGFPMTTYCGSTAQKNDWKASWADFYGECRLRHICRLVEENHGTDEELNGLLDTLVLRVVPRLLGDGHLGGSIGIKPVLVHGDLWEGNRSKGKFEERDAIEPVTYDPSCSYAHSEFELCLMRMFGGFSAGFFNEYHQLVPKTNPKHEYDDRITLYEIYHYLNHYAIYGEGYRDDAIRRMKELCSKYTRS